MVTVLDSLTDAQKFALSALLEVQPPSTVGDFVGEMDEGDHVVTYRFATTLPGYPGWNWTIAVAHLPEEEATVVESELLPADGALLAPDWVPWSDRMDDYRAAQLALGEAAAELDDDDDDDDDDEDIFGSDNLHGGDLDGVDIDEIDDASDAVDELSDSVPEFGDPVPDLVEGSEFVEGLEFVEGRALVEVSEFVEGSGAFDLQVDERDEAKAEGDGGSENPPRVSRRRKRASKEQQDNQGD
jgi:Protein of unknown function (DUF3027)